MRIFLSLFFFILVGCAAQNDAMHKTEVKNGIKKKYVFSENGWLIDNRK